MILSLVILGWIVIWSGYNTTYFNCNSNKFNAWRSLIPLIAGIPAFFFVLFNPSSLLSPLGLIIGYVVIGVVAAFFSPRQVSISLWWAAIFASVVLFLQAVTLSQNALEYITLIININWVIASILSLGLMGFFLIQPGVLKNISFNSFFASSIRPFEGWLDIPVAKSIFGLIGTRPTGIARYAGDASLAVLCFFVTYHSWYWFILFCIFTFILLFSKGKTEIGAFVVAMGFVLLVSHNLLNPLMLTYLIISVISYVIVFGNVPYNAPKSQKEFQEQATVKKFPDKNEVSYSKKVFKERMLTLSGRTTGVWPQAISFIKKKPLMGYGFGIEHYLLRGWMDKPATVDNTLLNLLLQTGIIGTVFFLLSLGWIIIMAYHLLLSGCSLILLEASSIGIFILLRGITQSFSVYSADWMFLAPIIAYIQLMVK